MEGRVMWASISPYSDEWRGNKIVDYKIYRKAGTPPDSPARVLYLCTSDDVAEQIRATAAGRCTDLGLSPEKAGEFTHRLYLEDGFGPGQRHLLDLLSTVLTVRVPHLDLVLAADWYKIPPDEDHPEWRDTNAGALVQRAKYWKSSPGTMESARESLTDGLAKIIQRHPWLKNAHDIATVPGHDASVPSCGEDLAARVAKRCRKFLIGTEARTAVRPQRKEGEQFDLTDEFSMPFVLSDRTVIVIDDVLRRGTTMSAVALAARRAGAAGVLGLVPARTMRG